MSQETESKPFENQKNSLLVDIWQSFFAMPRWVQVWVGFILMPVNMLSLVFINEPLGAWVAFLANIGMALNLPVLIKDRGFSKLMAIPHLVPWTIVVALILVARPAVDGFYDSYLSVLLVVNIISLAFDYPDALSWLRGDREVARPNSR